MGIGVVFLSDLVFSPTGIDKVILKFLIETVIIDIKCNLTTPPLFRV